MPKTAISKKAFSRINKNQLMKLRSRAKRAGVWFKALPRIDRVLVDLTIRVANSVRSATLAKNILAVTKKLEGLLASSLLRAFRGIGLQHAKKLCSIAQTWGNASAKNWIFDVSFITFLAAMHINEPKTFKL